jgi:phospholipid/cholesterol/gamma-HCH transport system ATP-binding protein
MIEVQNLCKRFGTQTVLKDVSLRIEAGESVVIIGRSGGGKSVLLKHLVGLLTPDSGEVRIDGRNIAGLDERELMPVRRKFGMLFQGAALFDSMSVGENIAFALRHQTGLSRSDIARKVAHALEMVELNDIENRKPSELSGGMRKRVGLARAIVYQPAIVLYDEPTTGLDPVVSDSIDRLIMRINEQLDATTVVVTHDMRSARRLGRRIVMLHQHRVYKTAPAEELFASTDPVIHRFVNGIAGDRDNQE